MTRCWKIYACRDEDVHQGCAWLSHPALKERSVIKISTNDGMTAFCEALHLDPNFVRDYDQRSRTEKIGNRSDALVIGGWHRKKLGGLRTGSEELLTIEVCPNHWCTIESWWARYKTCLDHPQVVVRFSAILGLWGFLLGVAGVILSLYQLQSEPTVNVQYVAPIASPKFDWLGYVILPAGMTIFLGGWVGLVCTRLMIFFQARYKAVTEYYQALEKLKDGTTPHDLVIALAHTINPAMQEFAALGHVEAAKHLNRMAREANREGARILNIPTPLGEFASLPNLKPDAFQDFRKAFVYFYYLKNISSATEGIARLRPNWWALFTPNPLPRYKHTDQLAYELNEEERTQQPITK